MSSRGTARLAGLIALLSACSSGTGKSEKLTISGRVFVAGKATALEDVDVVLPDGSRTKSGPQGAFSGQTRAGKTVAVESEGYAPVSKPAPAGDGYLELYAMPTDAKETLQASKGGEVVSEKGGKVNVPPNAFTSQRGKPAKEAEVELALPDPRKGTDLPSLPGDFDARRGGKAGKISAESAMYIGAKEGGTSLEVIKNVALEAAFPVYRATQITNPRLFYFNEETQEWEARGTVARINSKAAGARYEGDLDALGWWTVGDFYDRLTCVRGCVVDAKDMPAPFARAVATGVDHFTQVSAFAGRDGCFALSVRANAQITLSVQASDGFVAGRAVATGTTEIDVEEDPGDCQDLGKLELKRQEVEDCPQGLEKCAGGCVDLLSDSANCGACEDACDGTLGREQSCVVGECTCPRGYITCRGDGVVHCAQQATDVENCGGCGITCAAGETCVAGICEGDTLDGGVDDGGVSDGGDTQRVCEVVPLAGQECAPQTDVCLGASYRVQCTLGGVATIYDWRVSAPTGTACSVGCMVDNVTTGGTCSYASNLCGDPDVATVPCDPACPFPLDVPRPPQFQPPLPHPPTTDAGPVDPQTTPGNDMAGVVSCGGDAAEESPCTLSGSIACCIATNPLTATCTSSTACASTNQAPCDGPEDCSAGQFCCITDDQPKMSVRTECLAQCPASSGGVTVSTACHTDSDCGGGVCVRDSLHPFWGVCQ